jgi:hypothetical protein
MRICFICFIRFIRFVRFPKYDRPNMSIKFSELPLDVLGFDTEFPV